MKSEIVTIVPDQKTIDIYVACFHSQPGQDLRGSSGQFEVIEKAIQGGEWPYDNGDDPSFYQARRGNPLTWGVCRQNVRNAVQKDDIVVFIAFTKLSGKIVYRLCAVATVGYKLDHRFVTEEPDLNGREYINVLIEPDPQKERWIHSEKDRRHGARHKDWLWRMADHTGIDQKTFNRELSVAYAQGWFSNATTICGKPLRMAGNYVVFAENFVAKLPLEIAHASKGSRETWMNNKLKDAIFRGAPKEIRTNIRTTNPSIAHPHIRWSVEPDRAREWKDALVREMKNNNT